MDMPTAFAWLAVALPAVVLSLGLLARLAPPLAPPGFRPGHRARWSALPKNLRVVQISLSVVRVALVVLVVEWSTLRTLDWHPVAEVALGLLLAWMTWILLADWTT